MKPAWPDPVRSEPHGPGRGPGTGLWSEPGAGRLELFAGPLDGSYLDVLPLTLTEIAGGVVLDSGEGCTHPGGFSVYRWSPTHPGRMCWEGDIAP